MSRSIRGTSCADASPARARVVDPTLHVVAQGAAPNVDLRALGTRIVLTAGPLVYEAKDDELALIGGPAAYASL